ncbi:PQQ-dependent sugar dehydrogenase [Pedobacter glucosidilyticus]|uniref:PQQ-dependent sugar dehydrogenase n=1 Tax=Pedobacter glucosidilyticus TaxID=1122941 RepID=UPI00040FC697|nr:PQQ-dependent sugar dehydrogenase [Pedobacter glucosidilyticus]
MFKPIITVISAVAISAALYQNQSETKPTITPVKLQESKNFGQAAVHYKTYCGGCHGENLNTFIDRKWKYGNTRADIFKGIKNGYPDGGMPSFAAAFKDNEIYNLADYILDRLKNADKYAVSAKPKSNIFKTEKLTIRLDTIYAGGQSPWSIAFLPDGDLLVTYKEASLKRISKDKKATEVSGLPEILSEGQGGLMDILLHPEFKKNQTLYLSYNKFKKVDGKTVSTTAIMMAKLSGNQLTEQKDIFVAEPYQSTRRHYGAKMIFANDGYLYFSVGERGDHDRNPQSLDNNSLGKIHRIHADGSIPKDNPFLSDKKVVPSIYSYGHRNPQGLAVNPKNGQIISHEHGPRGGDELNLILPKKNYGWPVISYGINYNGTILTNRTAKEGMEQPLHYWVPSIAPSGLAFANGNIYKGWDNNVMIGSLKYSYLNRCEMVNNKVVKEELLFQNIGRVRDVRTSPDGYLYMTVENPGIIYKLVPIN